MSTWNTYKRKGLSEMRAFELGETLENVSISNEDKDMGSPKEGDMIARNPKNEDDQWLVAKEYFDDNFEPLVVEVEQTQTNIPTPKPVDIENPRSSGMDWFSGTPWSTGEGHKF